MPQRRSEDNAIETFRLIGMLAPTFLDVPIVEACVVAPPVPDAEHVRPLSTYLDVRDELLGTLARLLQTKPIWERDQLIKALAPYTREVILFNLHQAIQSAFRFKDSFGRPALLESRGDFYALAPIGDPNRTMVERTTRPPAQGSVALPEPSAPPEAPKEVAPDFVEAKLASFVFPADARERFSPEILRAFIVDHQLTPDEKRAYLRTRPRKEFPTVDRLVVPGTDYLVLGKDTFDPPESPEAEDRTAYLAWNEALVTKFIEAKDTLFASLKAGKLTVSKMTVEGDTVKRKREPGAKKYEPIVCDTGENSSVVMNIFAKTIDARGVGIPSIPPAPGKAPKLITGPGRCIYIELLAREEHNCLWIAPEELSVLYDGKAAKGRPPTNQDRFTAAFRK